MLVDVGTLANELLHSCEEPKFDSLVKCRGSFVEPALKGSSGKVHRATIESVVCALLIVSLKSIEERLSGSTGNANVSRSRGNNGEGDDEVFLPDREHGGDHLGIMGDIQGRNIDCAGARVTGELMVKHAYGVGLNSGLGC